MLTLQGMYPLIQLSNKLVNLKGQRVISPDGQGEVLETIGDKVVVNRSPVKSGLMVPEILNTTAARVKIINNHSTLNK